MSLYHTLKKNPTKIIVVENPSEVHFDVISCTCDNKAIISFKKQQDGSFNVHANGHAMSNFGLQFDHIDLDWAARDNKWNEVAKMINSGYSLVSRVRSR